MAEKNSNEYDLSKMNIVELSAYYNIVKTMIDACLFKLKLQLTYIEKNEINSKRLEYNKVLDKIEEVLNYRINQIGKENE